MKFTVLPFVVAFMAGLLALRALDIYQINAWNIGTAKVDAWRSRSNGIARSAVSAVAWIMRLFQSRAGMACAAVAVALLMAYLASAHPAGDGFVLALIVPAATAREIREQREKLIHDAGELRGANNTFENDEKRASFDAMLTDIETLGVALRDHERSEQLAVIQRTTLPETQRTAATGTPAAAATEARDRAIGLYLRGVPMGDMAPEERQALTSSYRTFSADEQRQVAGAIEQRDMSTVSAPAGGILVAPDTRFYGSIIQAMKFFGGMEAAGAQVINTDTAGALPIALGDDTGNVGSIVPEAKASGHAGGTSPTVSEMVLHGYLYSSKTVKVSWQILRDSALGIEAYVGGLLGQRLARIQNTHFTATGTGGGMPKALTLSVTVGRQSATGNTTSVPFDDILRTIHSLGVAYRESRLPSVGWMMHDNSILALRLAKDGNGRYLWPELGSVQVGQPGVLEGYRYTVNNDMPVMAASAKWATFGDHNYYKIRRIGGITITRLNELYAESGQVGFLAFQSADGGYANPGQDPIVALQNSAS